MMGIKKIEKRLGFAALAFAVQMLVASEVVSPQLNDFRFNGVNIPSDPELESQINDRISFKSFLRLPFDMTSPDHSTFSRFRKRLSEKAMTQINSEVLKQFGEKGLSINEGIAIDARLVQSASRPVSSDQLKQLREKRQSDEGKVDKNGKPLKFSRDVGSTTTRKAGGMTFPSWREGQTHRSALIVAVAPGARQPVS
jgi:IS5 family transposase